MSSFNSQYAEYYNKVKRERGRYKASKSNSKFDKKPKSSLITRRIIRDLIGVLVLFAFVISCKLIVTPQTQAAYKYSKDILEKSYSYSSIDKEIKSINISTVKNSIIYWFEKLRSKMPDTTGFIKPVQGVVTSSYGYRKDPITGDKKFHSGIDLDVKENSDVLASFDGKVKLCGEDPELGKYIILDHGEGVETKYGHLNEISVKKDDAVKKGEVIAKSGNTGKSTGPHLHFELLYMGENINPGVIK